MQSLAEARKGIKTQEGLTMANNSSNSIATKLTSIRTVNYPNTKRLEVRQYKKPWMMTKSPKWLTVVWLVAVG